MAKIILQVTGSTIQVVTKITKKAFKALTTVGNVEIKNEQTGKTDFVLSTGEPQIKSFAVSVNNEVCIVSSFKSNNIEKDAKQLELTYAGISAKLNKAEKIVSERYDALLAEADTIKVVYTEKEDEE